MTRLAYVMSFALVFTAIVSSVLAQTGYRPKYEYGEARFIIAAADFRSDSEAVNNLEIYYKIFNDALSYQKTGEGYIAQYEVAIIVEGENGRQVGGTTKDGQIKAADFAETRRTEDFTINVITMAVAPQDITVRVILTDKTAQNSLEEKVVLKRRQYRGKYPCLSRIEYARDIGPATSDSKFNKGAWRIIPSVTRVFGGDSDSLLRYYQEIYPGEIHDKYCRVITRILHRTRGVAYADTLDLGDFMAVEEAGREINVGALIPGDYELDIRLEGRRGRLYDRLTEEFELELTAETMYRSDYITAVEMLRYLATKEENDKLKKAAAPDERKKEWDAFWVLRNKDDHDRENPTKEEYFRRIRHANRNFSFMKKEGWRTSRGMIYITYGEPDEVEDFPFELASKPYQIWHYYRTIPSRSFLFSDEWGDGNYDLQPPYDGVSY